MKVAIIGATGLVGRMMARILEERDFPVTELIPAASERSVGKMVAFKNKEHQVVGVEEALSRKPDFALFSAGKDLSLKYAQRFATTGTIVIDNSSAWRMEKNARLIVPEVNGNMLSKDDRLIANPNCSTIQLMVAVHPLQKKYGLNRMVVSTYQAVSGSGQKALDQMEAERNRQNPEPAYPHPIDLNCLPHGGDFLPNGYTSEEMKLVNESRKILSLPELRVTATVVRIPVETGHSESVNLEFEKDFDIEDICEILAKSPGINLLDKPEQNKYPMPLYAVGKDDVFVGRIRSDESLPKALNMWVVSDNLRKGAATNAVQIAERMLEIC
ncbi:MAG: aspartate-semialdehyde dehydrogenase [Bacteroidales bacterium]|nr:aspartate-semialdehyde dehydrogenase [Bacteroidales bacterium]MCF8350585.1 aspartate-semialdehyde dehydrogenase [Bacteroidales bacterium]MCF8377247.1 aspartate-semialdehyde dehydrogenase [Bacteroidales bacterium]MCF8401993.1 aspartate-semialdehyde dehydrogenase [Bacteroidales bacterium]